MAESMTWVDELVSRVKARCQKNASLAPLTTFRIGGPADVLVEPSDDDEVLQALRVIRELGVPFTMLGGGSNVLIGDGGIRGVTMRLTGKLSAVVTSENGKRVDVGAGASFAKLTKACMALGWPRSNGWVGTPGTVGGAFIMNAGSREGEVGEHVESIRLIDGDEVRVLTREQCGFAYRTSAFPKGSLLLGGVLRCNHADPGKAAEIQAMASASLKRRHASQPKEHGAGSIFKNPPGDYAGRLIEAAGLKGTREGGALISPVHANFIVNAGGATARDVVTLAERCQREVMAKSGVQLEWEVRRMGEFT
ncbi:MAG: UDP-N-acetylmuramate dehydrogenase [Myxococcota bacterium]